MEKLNTLFRNASIALVTSAPVIAFAADPDMSTAANTSLETSKSQGLSVGQTAIAIVCAVVTVTLIMKFVRKAG
jgi:hypothetical protein